MTNDDAGAKPQIIFHIGLERTGTTSFQRFCHDHRRALLARGVLYPTNNLAFARASRNHASLVAAYIKEYQYIDLDMTTSWRCREEVASSLRREIETVGAPRTLISAEHMSSRFPRRQIEMLANDFADFDIRVAVVLREHFSRIRSAYSSTIRAGRALTFAQYLDELLLPANWYIRYAATLAPWAETFGRDKIDLFWRGDGVDIVEVLARRFIAADLPLCAVSEYRDNAAQSARILEAMRAINETLIKDARAGAQSRAKHELLAFARSHALNALAAKEQPAVARELSLDAPHAAALGEIVEDDRRWLLENYGLEAPPWTAPTPCGDAIVMPSSAPQLPRVSAALLWFARNIPL